MTDLVVTFLSLKMRSLVSHLPIFSSSFLFKRSFSLISVSIVSKLLVILFRMITWSSFVIFPFVIAFSSNRRLCLAFSIFTVISLIFKRYRCFL